MTIQPRMSLLIRNDSIFRAAEYPWLVALRIRELTDDGEMWVALDLYDQMPEDVGPGIWVGTP